MKLENIEDIIFLGAGASAAHGAPVQSRLFEEYFKGASGRQQYGGRPGMKERLEIFFMKFFGIDVTNNNKVFPTCEEVFGMIYFLENNLTSFEIQKLEKKEIDQTFISYIADDLKFCIAIVLNEKLEIYEPYHLNLINRLLENRNDFEKTAFINFNYDILLDNALENAFEHNHEYSIDYGIKFRNLNIKKKYPIKLYKLHGSLNWLFCQNCKKFTFYLGEKKQARIPYDHTFCDYCHQIYNAPLLIAPTYYKNFNRYAKMIWHRIEKVLISARKLIFCGYSFPEADLHIRFLLRKAIIEGAYFKEVNIVNIPHKEYLEQKDSKNKEFRLSKNKIDEMNRYESFFKDQTKVNYQFLSFQEFAKNGLKNERSRYLLEEENIQK